MKYGTKEIALALEKAETELRACREKHARAEERLDAAVTRDAKESLILMYGKNVTQAAEEVRSVLDAIQRIKAGEGEADVERFLDASMVSTAPPASSPSAPKKQVPKPAEAFKVLPSLPSRYVAPVVTTAPPVTPQKADEPASSAVVAPPAKDVAKKTVKAVSAKPKKSTAKESALVQTKSEHTSSERGQEDVKTKKQAAKVSSKSASPLLTATAVASESQVEDLLDEAMLQTQELSDAGQHRTEMALVAKLAPAAKLSSPKAKPKATESRKRGRKAAEDEQPQRSPTENAEEQATEQELFALLDNNDDEARAPKKSRKEPSARSRKGMTDGGTSTLPPPPLVDAGRKAPTDFNAYSALRKLSLDADKFRKTWKPEGGVVAHQRGRVGRYGQLSAAEAAAAPFSIDSVGFPVTGAGMPATYLDDDVALLLSCFRDCDRFERLIARLEVVNERAKAAGGNHFEEPNLTDLLTSSTL